MTDTRFPEPGVDTRFPGLGIDTRFPGASVDARFPGLGQDARFQDLLGVAVCTSDPFITGNLAATTLHVGNVGTWTDAVAYLYRWLLDDVLIGIDETVRPDLGGELVLGVAGIDANGRPSAYVFSAPVTISDWLITGTTVEFGPEPPDVPQVTMSGPLVTGIVGTPGKEGKYIVTNTTSGEVTAVRVPEDTSLPFDVTAYGQETDIIDVQFEDYGPYSPTITRADVPAAISNLAVTPGAAQNVLTWSAPASGSTITDYRIYVKSGGGSYVLIADGTSASTGYTHTGLTNGTAYTYYVAAVSAEGEGAPSNEVTGTPAVAGQTFEELWVGKSNGNTWTQMDAAYSRTATVNTNFVTEGSAPNGVRLDMDASSTPIGVYRDDIDTAISGTWSRFQIRARVRVPSEPRDNSRGGVGWFSGSAFYGVRISRGTADGAGAARLYSGQDYSVTSGTTAFSTTLSDNSLLRFIIEVGVPDKLTIRAKFWTGSTEPEWGGSGTITHTVGSDLAPPWLGLVTWNSVQQGLILLGYTVGIDADAPATI